MAGNLTGNSPSSTYKSLIHVDNASTGLTASWSQVYDGTGAATTLEVSTAGTRITNLTILGTYTLPSAVPVASGGTGSTTAAAARTALGLAIGTDVQAYDAELAALAGLTSAANKVPYFTGSGTAGVLDFLDEDTMSSDSATAIPSQQSVKAYVDSQGSGISNVVEDTTPQLGGNLDLNGFTITGLVIGTDVQAYDAELAALAGLTSAANKLPYFTGSGTASTTDLTTFGRSLIDDTDASTARTTLGLVIGTDVQAYDAELAALAGLTSAANKVPYFTGSGTAGVLDFLDEDNMASNSATAVASQQSIKAYVDGQTYGITDIVQDTTPQLGGNLDLNGFNITGLVIGTDVQAYDADLTTLASAFTTASASGPASLTLAEDTDNGSNTITLIAPASIATDKTVTFQDVTGTVYISNGTDVAVADGGTGASDASTARTNLGLVIGTDVQAYDAELAALAGLTSAANKVPYFTGSGTAGLLDFLDEDTMSSDSATAVPSQQSVKAYVDGQTYGITDIVQDTTPQLGGNLDLNGFTITGLVIGTDVQAYDAELAAIAGLTSAADKGIQFTGSGTAATYDLTAAGKALLDDADASAQRTTLGLVIGTDVQAYDAELAALAGLTSAANKVPYFTGSGTADVLDFLDEDTMSSNSATAVASQQSIKAYVDSQDHEWVKISTATASASATVDFTGLSSTYLAYKVIINEVSPATDATVFQMRVGTGATPTWQSGATDYNWAGSYDAGGTHVSQSALTDTEIDLGTNYGNGANETGSWEIIVHDPSQTNEFHLISGVGGGYNSAGYVICYSFTGAYQSTTAVTGIRFLYSSGNIATGEFTLYGLKA